MNRFREAIRQQNFIVTATLPLKPASTVSQIKEAIEILAPVIDAIQVADDRYALGHMSPLAAACIVLQHELDAIPHISCRDSNRIALQADILGAAALGVTTLVLSRGEKFSKSTALPAKGVFHLAESQLIQMAKLVSSDSSLVSDPGFHIGSVVTAFKPGKDWEAARIQEKIDAGTRFLQTQPCLNIGLLRNYMKSLIELKVMHRASVIVEVPLLTSQEDAKKIKRNYKGATIPEPVIRRVLQSADPIAEGILICAEMISELKGVPGVSGVNIQYEGDSNNVVAAIRESERC
ncbi:MAG: methylenetetrahydrofolate reductase [Woeseiaceae bacterium]